MCADCCPDVSLQPLDLAVQGSDHRHVGEHELPASGELEFTDRPWGALRSLANKAAGFWRLSNARAEETPPSVRSRALARQQAG